MTLLAYANRLSARDGETVEDADDLDLCFDLTRLLRLARRP